MDHYEKMIAQIDQTISNSGERINGLTNNVNRAINLMTGGHPEGLTAVERDVLLSFEALCVESLWRTAWLFHERDERGAPNLPLLEVSINAGVVLREFSEERIESTAADFNTYKVARRGDIVFMAVLIYMVTLFGVIDAVKALLARIGTNRMR